MRYVSSLFVIAYSQPIACFSMVRYVLILLCLVCSCEALQAQVVPQTVVIKLKAHHPAIGMVRSGVQPDFGMAVEQILGRYTTQSYIQQSLIDGVRRHFADRDGEEMVGIAMAESLERLMVIRYTHAISPRIAAQKLSAMKEIEYAEPMPQHTLFFTPNDPLAAQQYHLNAIRALDAWDIASSTASILVAVTDSGFDYTHQDLSANAYTNPGESGTDTQGRDRRTNGVDDDNNGFIDDWRGWDFIGASSNTPTPDNDPRPGNSHGTHVAGIIGAVINNNLGVAGVARSVRVVGIKCGGDNSGDRSISFGFNAILYGALLRASVINASWGSSTYARSEQEVIYTATRMGTLVVAAAGNDNSDVAFYPGLYDGVLSVSSVLSGDEKSSFSNYNVAVKLAMPGTNILSTFPNNQYQFLSGTSMASPVAAGLAAMLRARFPQYTPQQVIAHLQATSDPIYTIGVNVNFRDQLGSGRGNAFRALSTPTANLKRMSVVRYRIADANGNGILEQGERAQLFLTVRNQLSAATGVRVLLDSPFSLALAPSLTVPTAIGDFSANEERELTVSLSFTVSMSAPENATIQAVVRFSDASVSMGNDGLLIQVNPTFRTMDSNNITMSLNSEANIGFNDFPDNVQGEGFVYRGGENLLYEGALLVGNAIDTLSDNARSDGGATRNTDFKRSAVVRLQSPGGLAPLEGYAEFDDRNSAGRAGVQVRQTAYQFRQSGLEDCVFLSYALRNTSNRSRSRMFAGLYFDWDIGPLGAFNQAFYDSTAQLAVMQNVRDTALPMIATILLTPQTINFRAIDNPSSGSSNFGVYDGFTRAEKILSLTNGISRARSSVGDDSYMLGAGPFVFPRDTSVNVNFAIIVGKTLQELRIKANAIRQYASRTGLDGVVRPRETFFTAYPDPVERGQRMTIEFMLTEQERTAVLEVYNIIGERVMLLAEGTFFAGLNRVEMDTQNLASGIYVIVYRGQAGVFSQKVIVAR